MKIISTAFKFNQEAEMQKQVPLLFALHFPFAPFDVVHVVSQAELHLPPEPSPFLLPSSVPPFNFFISLLSNFSCFKDLSVLKFGLNKNYVWHVVKAFTTSVLPDCFAVPQAKLRYPQLHMSAITKKYFYR